MEGKSITNPFLNRALSIALLAATLIGMRFSASGELIPPGARRELFIDNRPGAPSSERYKANMVWLGEGKNIKGLLGYVFGDGIHWKSIREAPIVLPSPRNNFDSQNVMFWSEIEQKYVLYARHSEGELPKNEISRRLTGGIRAVARATSKDFLHWSMQTLMTYSDTGSATPFQHLYTNQTTPYFRAPQIYISLPGRFQAGRGVLTEEEAKAVAVNPAGGGVEDIADGVLLTTRAGSTRSLEISNEGRGFVFFPLSALGSIARGRIKNQ